MANFNISRLTEDVKREISAALPAIKDKRVSSEIVSISRVEITSDLSYCKIYVSALGSEGEGKAEEAAAALERAAGFIVKRINSRIRMRKMPKLIFLPDNSQEYYERISRIIDSLPGTGGESSGEDMADSSDYEDADEGTVGEDAADGDYDYDG